MWHTGSGDRVLAGAERELFRAGLESLVYYLDQSHDLGDPFPVRIVAFDSMTHPQKLAMLEFVASALFLDSIPPPIHTCINEASIAAVFYHIKDEIEVEIDERQTELRRLIRSACAEKGNTDELPGVRSTDMSAWDESVEFLMDEIFWDRDWEEQLLPIDMNPAALRSIKKLANIDDEYYIAIAPDPKPQQLASIRTSLRRLTAGPK